jgi:hypothetical protein
VVAHRLQNTVLKVPVQRCTAAELRIGSTTDKILFAAEVWIKDP